MKRLMFSAVFILMLCVSCKPDSVGEEILEDVIRAETGINVDLTPGSPEK